MAENAKSWLYAFCGKKKVTPSYEVRNSGPKHRQRFLCEVRVPGYNYIGVGNSTSKKDSQSNAAKDFIQFLVRQGDVQANEIPDLQMPDSGGGEEDASRTEGGGEFKLSAPMAPVPGLREEGNVYHPIQREGRQMTYMERIQERKATEDAEDVDLTANIHGNWTIENSKSRLHMFLQTNKIKADYKYSAIGPDHNRQQLTGPHQRLHPCVST
ncbi:hypothetical protein OTU49_007995 [Cherax quadricarinatus]|uniref:DRBM domain-containing protein n=1 Tax=Cherax quadricarinatus TaxID=27406 RepID=A0AAW0WTX0_CHEQU